VLRALPEALTTEMPNRLNSNLSRSKGGRYDVDNDVARYVSYSRAACSEKQGLKALALPY